MTKASTLLLRPNIGDYSVIRIRHKISRNVIRLQQPDSPITVIPQQFLVLLRSHIARPDHILSVDFRTVINPVEQRVMIWPITYEYKVRSRNRSKVPLESHPLRPNGCPCSWSRTRAEDVYLYWNHQNAHRHRGPYQKLSGGLMVPAPRPQMAHPLNN